MVKVYAAEMAHTNVTANILDPGRVGEILFSGGAMTSWYSHSSLQLVKNPSVSTTARVSASDGTPGDIFLDIAKETPGERNVVG